MRAWFIISALCLTSMSASIVLPMKVAIAQTVNDRKVEADRLLAQGVREYQTNQFEASLKSGQEALKIYREVSDNNGEAWALNNLGSAYRIFNQTEKSILYYEKALSIFNKLGDYKGEASALTTVRTVF